MSKKYMICRRNHRFKLPNSAIEEIIGIYPSEDRAVQILQEMRVKRGMDANGKKYIPRDPDSSPYEGDHTEYDRLFVEEVEWGW